MSHHSLAAVWAQLETRADTDNIFCEVIGRSNLESNLALTDSVELENSSLYIVVFIKVIFDLQRTYLQDSRLSLERPYLLRPQLLLIGIIHLLRLKCKIYRAGSISEQHVAERSFIVQTLVSGLRALWLRRYKLKPKETTQLRSAFQEAWEHDELNGLDSFLVQTLCHQILHYLANSPSELSYPACEEVTLRDYNTGLYPLESRLDELVRPVKNAALSLSADLSADNLSGFRSYWTVFDIAWATEAALIQLCIHDSGPRGSTKSVPPTQDDMDELSLTRRGVLDAIFGSQTIKEVYKESMAAMLLNSCVLKNCICVSGAHFQLNDMNTIGARATSTESYRKSNIILHQFLSNALTRLTKVLEYRKETLRDCNGDLSDVSDSLDRYLDAWVSDTSSTQSTNEASRPDRRAPYIVNCPELHPISYHALRSLIEDSAGKVGLAELEKDSSHFCVDIRCGQCEAPRKINKVRQVEPLLRLATSIKEKLVKKPSQMPEWLQLVSDMDHQPRNQPRNSSSLSTILSSGSSASNSTGLSEKNPMRPLTDFFEKPPHRSNGLRDVPSYCFSSDGQSLLLWIRYTSQIAVYDINSRQIGKFSSHDVNFAAAGANYYAVTSGRGNGQNLSIYSRIDGTLVDNSELPISAAMFSLTFARNDKFIALGFASDVWIYVLETRNVISHRLPSARNAKPQGQRASFSADGEKLIVATRYIGGNVQTYVVECVNPNVGRALPCIQIQGSYGKDFGLSSVLYDSKSNHAFLTSFTQTSPVIFPPQNCGAPLYLDRKYHHHLGTQIQCAAYCPSGTRLALVNDKNEIFTVQKHANARWQVEKIASLGRQPIVAKADMMVMVMPREGLIHLFWIKGAEWMLMSRELHD